MNIDETPWLDDYLNHRFFTPPLQDYESHFDIDVFIDISKCSDDYFKKQADDCWERFVNFDF